MKEDFAHKHSIGRNIERIRRIKGINQDSLAAILGMSRQTLSKLEQAQEIDPDKLDQIARGLGVTADSIRHFNEDAIFNNIVHDHGTVFNHVSNYHFNPIEKMEELYEALLKSEREKVEMLQKLLNLK